MIHLYMCKYQSFSFLLVESVLWLLNTILMLVINDLKTNDRG